VAKSAEAQKEIKMKWDTDSEDNITVGQVTSFHVAPAMSIAVAVRIEYKRMSNEGEIVSDSVQLAMSPKIASQLADDLGKVAQHILGLARPDKSN
jgi:hypothetical protein